jgi:hypothetical protein
MIYFGKKWDILVKGGGVLVKVGGIFGRVRFGSEGVLTCIPSQVQQRSPDIFSIVKKRGNK